MLLLESSCSSTRTRRIILIGYLIADLVVRVILWIWVGIAYLIRMALMTDLIAPINNLILLICKDLPRIWMLIMHYLILIVLI